MEKKLCFKCHKPGCSSKTCKNPRTVYSKVKKKATVTNVKMTNDHNNKGKDKEVAKINEVDEEDFVKGDLDLDLSCPSPNCK